MGTQQVSDGSNAVFLDGYQHWTGQFQKYNPNSIIYPTLKLNGEAGEIAEKVGKLWRDQDITLVENMSQEQKIEIAKELGGALWYIARIASNMGFKFSRIAEMNIEKLESRRARGVLSGSGDNR